MFRSFHFRVALVVFFLLSDSVAATGQSQPADLVLRNGKIVTLDPKKPGAQALAVRGGVIVAGSGALK